MDLTLGRTVDQLRVGVCCARTSFEVEIKDEAVLFSPRKRESIRSVRMAHKRATRRVG